MKRRNLIFRVFTHIILASTSFVMIYPVLYMALGAFTTNARFLEANFLPLPNTLNFPFFSAAMTSGVWRAYQFTLIRASFYLVVTLSVGLTAGYIFSKMRFPGRNQAFLLLLSGMVMPGILMLVPGYMMMAKWPLAGGNDILGQGGHGFIGAWPVLFIGGWVPPFAIFLLKQSFDMLPKEYEDAAKMDGAGLITIIFRVYGPLLKPPVIALVIVTALGIWNDYLWPLMTVSGHPELYPIAYAIQFITITQGQVTGYVINYPAMMILAFLATWPPAVLYFTLQRYFVQGLVSSGLKG